MWNLVILEPYSRHCYLEGCYEDFKEANKRGHEVCGKSMREYKVMSETEYIQFKNPYY